LLMVLFWFPFKFLLVTAAAIDNNNFLVLHHVAKFVLCELLIYDVYSQRREDGRIAFSIACSAGTNLHT
jgi:hypothetical protein